MWWRFMDKKIIIKTLVICLLTIGISCIGTVSAADQDLADKYAPILYFKTVNYTKLEIQARF